MECYSLYKIPQAVSVLWLYSTVSMPISIKLYKKLNYTFSAQSKYRHHTLKIEFNNKWMIDQYTDIISINIFHSFNVPLSKKMFIKEKTDLDLYLLNYFGKTE